MTTRPRPVPDRWLIASVSAVPRLQALADAGQPLARWRLASRSARMVDAADLLRELNGVLDAQGPLVRVVVDRITDALRTSLRAAFTAGERSRLRLHDFESDTRGTQACFAAPEEAMVLRWLADRRRAPPCVERGYDQAFDAWRQSLGGAAQEAEFAALLGFDDEALPMVGAVEAEEPEEVEPSDETDNGEPAAEVPWTTLHPGATGALPGRAPSSDPWAPRLAADDGARRDGDWSLPLAEDGLPGRITFTLPAVEPPGLAVDLLIEVVDRPEAELRVQLTFVPRPDAREAPPERLGVLLRRHDDGVLRAAPRLPDADGRLLARLQGVAGVQAVVEPAGSA